MYYIYHIPGVKIGCTSRDPKQRVSEQGYENFYVLEMHEDIEIASKREIELQEQYGYGRDNPLPYSVSSNIATFEGRSKGGKTRSKDSKLQSNAGKIGGKIGGKISGKKNIESGHLDNIRQKANIINQQKINCMYCGKSVNRLNHSRWHGNNCKMKQSD